MNEYYCTVLTVQPFTTKYDTSYLKLKVVTELGYKSKFLTLNVFNFIANNVKRHDKLLIRVCIFEHNTYSSIYKSN